jgi:subtilisin family serine protease
LSVNQALIQYPAYTAPNDTYDKQWGLTKIQAEDAWAKSDGTGATIAVVDTGVDMKHPDLEGKVLDRPGGDFVEPNGKCTGSKNQRMCIQDGAQDENGHGTHVAGIAAAITNNGMGIAGVAPGAQILPVRVLDKDGSGDTEQIAKGIVYAADNGAHVINLSLGYLSGVGVVAKAINELEPIYKAIAYAQSKDIVVVIAAGNDTVPLCAEPSAAPGVICVGSTDVRDLPSFFSNGDATMTKNFVVAPGGDAVSCAGDILSTFPTYLTPGSCSPQKGYEALAGTSMATPHVAGVAALLASKGIRGQAAVNCIVNNTDVVPGSNPVDGYGRLNAYKAVVCEKKS